MGYLACGDRLVEGFNGVVFVHVRRCANRVGFVLHWRKANRERR